MTLLHTGNILDPISDQLDPTVWEKPDEAEPILKPAHAHWITNAIYEVLENGGYSHPERWLDLFITGSLTTYQYSPDSDCDVSLFINATKLPEWSRAEMIGLMIDGFDDRLLSGTTHPMQCYVVAKGVHPADLYKPGLRSGYDIKAHHWIEPPDHHRDHDVESVENGFYEYAKEQADKMDRLLRYEPEKARTFWHQIHRRRMQDQSAGKGDFAESNIVYKFLNNRGLFPQIASMTGEHVGASESPWEVTVRTMKRDGFGDNEIEDWSNYLAQHNEADRDSGELGDVPDEQVERWYENWESEGKPHVAWTITSAEVEPSDNQALLNGNAGQDLQGLPGPANVPGVGPLQFHSNADIQRIANEYNQQRGLGQHPQDYMPVNPENAARIAQEYEAMPHSPNDPQTQEAYTALANEVRQQYDAAVQNGYRFEFYPQGEDPYPHSPRQAVLDLHRNKHMYVYPTESGYGSDQQGMDHPLLGDSGVRWNGQPVTHNDLFRAIHDFYGHAKEGLGFRAHGEDNAYRQHQAMFSPLARRALASETRGQNSWVNFGPYGEQNQTAGQGDTVYAPQKAGLMPEWTDDPNLHAPNVQMQQPETYPSGYGTISGVVDNNEYESSISQWTTSPYQAHTSSDLAGAIVDATKQDGGVTINLQGQRPSQGFAFSIQRENEETVPVDQLNTHVVSDYIARHQDALNEPGRFMGTWINDGLVYLDVSQVEDQRERAYDMAAGANQLAMYDINAGQEIPIDMHETF